MDALSEILKSLQVRHAAIVTSELSTPWGFSVGNYYAGVVYLVMEGPPCWLRFPTGHVVLLRPGDVALVIRAHCYCIASSPDGPCVDADDAWRAGDGRSFAELGLDSEPAGLARFSWESKPAAPVRFAWGGGGPVTRLVGFVFGLASERRNPLRDVLPELITVRGTKDRPFPWIAAALDFFSAPDTSSPGYATICRLLSELVLVSIVREHLLTSPHSARGWLRGLTDPCIARSLQAIHALPGAEWTVSSLAKVAGLSRTTLATRFMELVEVAPIEYLRRWRMQVAAERILTTQPNLSQLAFELGYTSDAAFRDVFKRYYGVPPSRYAGDGKGRGAITGT